MHCIQAVQIYEDNLPAYLNSPVGGQNDVQSRALTHFLRFLNPGARILDLGCGPGLGAELVLKSHSLIRVTGIDLSKAMIEYARKKVPAGTFHCLDIRKIRFPNDAFDAVIAASVIIHLNPEELVELIHKITAALKPDGLLFLNFWSGDYSGFKQLDFADRPMMIYYHDDSWLSRLIRLQAFGILGAEHYQRRLDTASGAESIRDVYYIGHILKSKDLGEISEPPSANPVVFRLMEKGAKKKIPATY